MNDYQIISVREHPQYLDIAVDYLTNKWGISRNIYQDCIENSLTTKSPLPRWYLMVRDGLIMGSYGLIVNDFISRQDLWPWLAALYVEENERGKGFGAAMLEHGKSEAQKLGFPMLYLSTGHVGYYEKYGWKYIGNGYDVGGEATRIYETMVKHP